MYYQRVEQQRWQRQCRRRVGGRVVQVDGLVWPPVVGSDRVQSDARKLADEQGRIISVRRNLTVCL